MKTKEKNVKRLWGIGLGASILGLVASFVQAVQTISHYKNPETPQFCDINSVFNCNSVFDAWQSSVFGFSNSLLCIVFFTVLLGITLVGFTGSTIAKSVRFFAHFLVLFFLGFGAWYLWSSTFVIAALCLYCIFCYTAVIILNAVWLRLNVQDLPAKSSLRNFIERAIEKNYDIMFWVLWGAGIAAMFVNKFV